ncbi:arginine transporter [Tatumella sp. TA1]|uniref:LysE/ArgO family amino acid transporter n=1 Tax=Rosenbergiella collisarenosi TaxID=1544695 RepID=UPI0008F8CBF8|nr:LysE family transporter [Rosenbergiella collisarenosi]QGX92364.1 arginine transporter [Tatumella sp. TA1]
MLFFLQGLAVGAALILPLGPQNTLVLRQGIFKRYAFIAATFCVVSDALLISTGVMGGSALLQQSSTVLLVITWAGVLFLLWYSYGVAKEVKTPASLANWESAPATLTKVLLTLTLVTWLNPHVYLDTVVLLGSIGSQIPTEQRIFFVMGAILASVLWFYSLAGVARLLSGWLVQPNVQRVINVVVVIILLTMAFRLAKEGVVMLEQLFHTQGS